jgi:hypothetical protein
LVDDVRFFLVDVSLWVEEVREEGDDGSGHRDVLSMLLADRRSKLADGDPIRAVVEEDLDVLLPPSDERSPLGPVLSQRDTLVLASGSYALGLAKAVF